MTTFFERLNPLSIVLNHFSTFYNSESKKLDWQELLIIFLICVDAPLYLLSWDVSINKKSEGLFQVFAIAGGFLINAMIVLADKKNNSAATDKRQLLKETFYNTSFGVLVCIISVVLCASYPFVTNECAKFFFTFFIFSLCVLFLHTILMVVKRLNRVFEI